jgi:hypothetical protein
LNREVQSEGSRRQRSVLTKRNRIIGLLRGNPAMKGEAIQSTVTEGGKSCRTDRKGKDLPWEISEPKGEEKSAAGIVLFRGEGPNL